MVLQNSAFSMVNGHEQACFRVFWWVGRLLSSPCQNSLIHKREVVDCVPVIKAIGKTTFPDQTRPDQTRPDQTRPDQTRPDQTRPESFHCIAFKMKLLSYLPLTVMCQLCIFENAMYFVPGEFLSECHSSSRWIKGVHSSREYILRTRAYLYRNADKNQKS